ncbi:MAG: valine--tRNA ligase [Oscillospiraceae bacterium]|jgi:valyl-tRNA synthetase|nr:valine--tRNA ligase [Oscillospiraceae bacterium]
MAEFEKRYDGLAVEKEMQAFWAAEKIYDFHKDGARPLYSIDTPPPTVSGSLHIGHIFSYTQAEMIARFRRMQGFNVFYPFGFDDNGLPSERLVEKETGIRASDLPRSEFREKCMSITQRYEDEFKALWKSMGFSCDWNLQYSTVSLNTQRLSQKSFLDLARDGHAYIKESPVLWCTECRTSIAQAELDSKDIDSFFHYIPFTIEGKVLEIATTRPELLYGVVCVFVNPEDERYTHLVGKRVKVPLYDFDVPLLTDDKVAIDKGTGAVMCATFGDTTDVEWVAQHDLPYKKVILADGHMADDVPFIAGLRTKAARKEIVRLLEEQNLLIKSKKLTHIVSVHERCGTEVEIIPSRQWYIDVLSRKKELLEAGDKIKWNPPQFKTRYVNWVENLKWDWCISRQRYFGIPIPVWYCQSCGAPHYASAEQLPVNPMETPYVGTCACGSTEFLPDSAVLDTWATSSITPLINQDKAAEYGIAPEDFAPMSMRTQAHEIIRTWAFYTIAKSLYHTGEIPWDETMICGFVLAKPGEKISKSKNNAKLSPQALIDTYSADAIRYWAASARLGTDTYFDIQDMQDTSKRMITKLWNSSKFVLSHLTDFDPAYAPAKLLPVDRWIIERTNEAILGAVKWLNSYEIGLARKLVDDLFWKDLCDNYIEIVKERLYQPDIHGGEARKSAQYAIYYCLLTVLKMYAIYIPHETEYIYQKALREFDGAKSIHLTQWPKPASVDADLLAFGETLKAAVAEVRKYKSENNLSMRADVESATIVGSQQFADWLRESEADFRACTHAQEIVYELT